MRIIKIKSEHPLTEYSPTWDIPIGQALWYQLDKMLIIKDWLIANEARILKEFPLQHDGGTGLGNDSVTSRFGRYNLFNFTNELPELAEFLLFIQQSYLAFVRLDIAQVRELEIVCWFNIMRQGQRITKHSHGSGSDAYLSGNMPLGNYSTLSTYECPYDKTSSYSATSTAGFLTFFPSYLPHSVSTHDEDTLRVSIAFDLRIIEAPNNEEFTAVPFMNIDILQQLNQE